MFIRQVAGLANGPAVTKPVLGPGPALPKPPSRSLVNGQPASAALRALIQSQYGMVRWWLPLTTCRSYSI